MSNVIPFRKRPVRNAALHNARAVMALGRAIVDLAPYGDFAQIAAAIQRLENIATTIEGGGK